MKPCFHRVYIISGKMGHHVGPASAPLKEGWPFFHECLRGIAVVLRLATMDVVRGFQIHTIVKIAGADGAVQVFLHVAVSHTRSLGESLGNGLCFCRQVLGRADPVGQTEP